MILFEEVRKEKLVHADVKTELPIRSDEGSAGYDFFSKEDFVIPGVKVEDGKVIFGKHLFFTDVKAKMPKNKVLLTDIRSGMGSKSDLMVSNTIGIIDSSYYGNPDNDGNIGISIRNLGTEDYVIKKGERIAQGVFVDYNITSDDKPKKKTRDAGFGSTGK